MTNLETAMALLERHRHGMAWTDKAVAEDMLKTFGIEEGGEFHAPSPYVPPVIPQAHIPSAPIVPPVVGTRE